MCGRADLRATFVGSLDTDGQGFINMTEKVGYVPALVNVGGGRQKLMPDVRNNDRCISRSSIASPTDGISRQRS